MKQGRSAEGKISPPGGKKKKKSAQAKKDQQDVDEMLRHINPPKTPSGKPLGGYQRTK